MLEQSTVSVVRISHAGYPLEKTFRPDEKYPEYLFEETALEKNEIYQAVREALFRMGLDAEHYGFPAWNPFGSFIKPGMTVLLKPNLVLDYNMNKAEGTDCLYTHPSVAAPVIDYVCIALRGRGRIVIGDAPVQGCNFKKLVQESGYLSLVNYYKRKKIKIKIADFRELSSKAEHGVLHSKIKKESKGLIVDLGKNSQFYGMGQAEIKKMRVTDYDPALLACHHSEGRHEYYISKYLLDADVVINIPKPKCHRKAGITASLKNFVGVNVRKEFLPHHTLGPLSEGGDEYKERNAVQRIRSRLIDERNKHAYQKEYARARFYNLGVRIGTVLLMIQKNKYREGSWYGNHTISKTIADINKIVYFADKNGKMQDRQQREILIISDFVISGEKEGPLHPSAKNVGIIAVGMNPVCFDEVIGTLMGFDVKKIPVITECRYMEKGGRFVKDGQKALICSNDSKYDGKDVKSVRLEDTFQFIPPDGWKHHIEKKD